MIFDFRISRILPFHWTNGSRRSNVTRIDGASFATPCVAPLAAVFVGFALLQAWSISAATFLLLAVLMLLPSRTTRTWMQPLSMIVGVSLYVTAMYLEWVLAGGSDFERVPSVLAGILLVFLSFITWVSSLIITDTAAWVGRGVAFVSLAGVVIVGGPLCGIG